MRRCLAIARRELGALAAAPTALVFLLAFAGLANLSVLGMERLFERGQADLEPLFSVLPWLGLLLLPALSMGLWSEERRTGSLELLLSLPVPTTSVVLGKFLAALGFAALALAGTLGLWVSVATFGEPDHGAILAGYVGALLLFSAFLALGSFVSALTRSSATAYVLSVALGFLFLFSDVPALGRVVEDLAGTGARGLLADLSLSAHFEALTRGVLGATDLAFFLSLSAVFLAGTVALVDGRRRDRRPTGRLLAYLALLLGLNLTLPALFGGMRLDCTSQGLYTLDPATRALVAELPEGTRLELFLTEEAAATSPRFQGFADHVARVVADLEQAAGGRLRVERVDPAPFTEQADRARAAGLSFLSLGVQGGGRELCFGAIATGPAAERPRSTGPSGEAVLPFLSPEREAHLERDLARLLLEAARTERPRVGVLGSADVVDALFAGGLQGQGWQVLDALRGSFEFVRLGPGWTPEERLPDGPEATRLDVLWVVHPEAASASQPGGLEPEDLLAIQAFAHRGGALLVHVDPLAEVDRAQLDPTDETSGYVAERSSDLPDLLEAWGLELSVRKVVLDRAFGKRLPAGAGGLEEAATNLHWLEAPASALGDSTLLADLGPLGLYTAGELRPAAPPADPGLEREPLLSASGDSMLLDVSELQVPRDPRELLASVVGSGQRQVLAWRLAGLTPAPELPRSPGAVDRWAAWRSGDQAAQEVVDRLAGARPMAAVVVADVDLLADGLWIAPDERAGQTVGYTAFGDNGPLIERLLGELAGGAGLAAVGTRALYTRPFTRFEQLERDAEERLARELAGARELEARLQAELLADEASLAASGQRPDPAAARELRRSLAAARLELRDLLRDRDAEVTALKRTATLWNALGFPLLLLTAAGLTRLGRRRG